MIKYLFCFSSFRKHMISYNELRLHNKKIFFKRMQPQSIIWRVGSSSVPTSANHFSLVLVSLLLKVSYCYPSILVHNYTCYVAAPSTHHLSSNYSSLFIKMLISKVRKYKLALWKYKKNRTLNEKDTVTQRHVVLEYGIPAGTEHFIAYGRRPKKRLLRSVFQTRNLPFL